MLKKMLVAKEEDEAVYILNFAGGQKFALEFFAFTEKFKGSGNSVIKALVPPNVKEHMMAAATSQRISPNSRRCLRDQLTGRLGIFSSSRRL